MASMALLGTVAIFLLAHYTTRANPVPAKILGKYVLSYQSPGSNIHLNAHEDPEEISELSNGIESGESDGQFVRSPTASKHYRYRPQYQQTADQYEELEQERDTADYADDSATASANHQHQYMTTYKTVTKHGGSTRNRPSYSAADSQEEEDEIDTSASEETNPYNAFRAYQNKGKKHQNHHVGGSSTGASSGQGGSSHYHAYSQYHHRGKHQEPQQQQPQSPHHYHHQVSSAHTSYHPQLIQAYKILHGTPNRLPTSHEYNDDEGSEEEDEDEDFHSGAAIGAAAGTPSGYGGSGPQIIHTKGRTIPISQHVEIETPVPVPYVKKIHVPIPQEVRVRIPHPVLVPIPRPYPVHIPVAQPIAVPDIKEITVPIEKIVPYPVEKKIPVPIEKPVPYPIEKHVPVYLPQPIPVKVPIVKTIIHKVKQQTASGPTLPPGSGSLW